MTLVAERLDLANCCRINVRQFYFQSDDLQREIAFVMNCKAIVQRIAEHGMFRSDISVAAV